MRRQLYLLSEVIDHMVFLFNNLLLLSEYLFVLVELLLAYLDLVF